jgi:hypothetical protein
MSHQDKHIDINTEPDLRRITISNKKIHQDVDISTVNNYRYLLKERGENCKNQKDFWIM